VTTHINDVANNEVAGQSIIPQDLSATVNGSSVDFLTGDGGAWAELSTGARTGTTPTLDVKLQESDDDLTFTDISGATFTQVTAANQRETINFRRSKRYVRAVATLAGTSPTFITSVTIHQQLKLV
jgi:hypothetical protein